jgi:hypothetical protein
MLMVIFMMLLASYKTLVFCISVNIWAYILYRFSKKIRYSEVNKNIRKVDLSAAYRPKENIAPAEENIAPASPIV